jgi:hypothetical protein
MIIVTLHFEHQMMLEGHEHESTKPIKPTHSKIFPFNPSIHIQSTHPQLITRVEFSIFEMGNYSLRIAKSPFNSREKRCVYFFGESGLSYSPYLLSLGVSVVNASPNPDSTFPFPFTHKPCMA